MMEGSERSVRAFLTLIGTSRRSSLRRHRRMSGALRVLGRKPRCFARSSENLLMESKPERHAGVLGTLGWREPPLTVN